MILNPETTLISDTECFGRCWSIGYRRWSDGKELVFSHTPDKPMTVEERARIARIMQQNTIVGYNFISYDAPMIALALSGASNVKLKQTSDRIIQSNIKPWQIEDAFGIEVPRVWDIIDLIEPQPNAFASLKKLAGRLHAPKMQDLPYEPDTVLTDEQIEEVLAYMGNDLFNTGLVLNALVPALELREALGQQYRRDFRSKSDSQIGEAIIRSQVEAITKQKVQRVDTPAGYAFHYKAPPWLSFEHPVLKRIFEKLCETQFVVQANGKVDLPPWLKDVDLMIGGTSYAMGIGGLHSMEKERAVVADYQRFIRDVDVRGYYPRIILGSGLYPRALGRPFLDAFRKIVELRDAGKARMQELDRLRKVRSLTPEEEVDYVKNRTISEGGKISSNGVYGKLGSPYSILYAPHLMIAVTLTGQLALLMLIERAEAAGISVVSANTDGVVFHCPRPLEGRLTEITKEWERVTGFELESTDYAALYSQSVNSYIAVKTDGKVKRKGTLANPRCETPPDIRTQLMNHPTMNICSDAVVAFLTKGVPLEQTIRSRTDIRDFVTVVEVQGGGTWRGGYLGKVVRYIWSKDGDPILYKKPHPTTGNFKKVPKSDGCRPVMTLPDGIPGDLDYDRYVEAAEELLKDYGAVRRPPEIGKVRVLKARRLDWLAVSLAA